MTPIYTSYASIDTSKTHTVLTTEELDALDDATFAECGLAADEECLHQKLEDPAIIR